MNISHTHTPGPWASGKLNLGYRAGTIPVVTPDYLKSSLSSRGRIIADVYGSIGEQEANARLIAAAPELLSALESAREFIVDGMATGFVGMPEDENVLEAIEKAISKAKKGPSK